MTAPPKPVEPAKIPEMSWLKPKETIATQVTDMMASKNDRPHAASAASRPRKSKLNSCELALLPSAQNASENELACPFALPTRALGLMGACESWERTVCR